MRLGRTVFEALPPIAAVGTLPAGILTAIFVGLEPAAVVFVVGWFLVLPLSAVINDEILVKLDEEPAGAAPSEDATDEERDPLETLRERYATGEIDDVEFERRLEYLVATEDIEVPPGIDLDPGDVEAGTDASAAGTGADTGDEERTGVPKDERERDVERERT